MFALLMKYWQLRRLIETSRVLDPNPKSPRVSQLGLLFWYHDYNSQKFCEYARVKPSTFDKILELIKDNSIFHNNSQNKQIPVKYQLAILLYRLGHYGNAASPSRIADWAGVSVGTVYNCTRRVSHAILALHDKAIHWPNTEQKRQAKAYAADNTCEEWREGYLAVDGTGIPVFERPRLHGNLWFSKDKVYAIALQVS